MALTNESDTFDIGGESTVHRLGYGAMQLTGEGVIGSPGDEDAARAVLRRAVELGVDFVDTKAGLLRNADTDWLAHGDPDYIHNQVLASRDRLGVETIDLYQFHRPDPDTPFEDSVVAFAELQDAGLVDHVGLSNVAAAGIELTDDEYARLS
jgi:pyridoxine 4-dehydrogenase